MPKMVICKPDPAYKPKDDADRAQYEAAKKKGPVAVSYQTGLENVRRSGGMYKIEESKGPAKPQLPDLESIDIADLKVMMLSLGIKTEKVMKKTDIIRLIRNRLEKVEVVDE